MDLHIAKWGNSLALRIPVEYIKAMGVQEGDRVSASLTADGSISIRAAQWDRKDFARQLANLRLALPPGNSVMDELRRGGRY